MKKGWFTQPIPPSHPSRKYGQRAPIMGLVESYQYHKGEVEQLESLIKTQGEAKKLKDIEKKEGLKGREIFLLYLAMSAGIIAFSLYLFK